MKIQKDKPFHLGTLILHANTEKGVYDIIDGQQRLVTISLILWGLGYDGSLPLLSAEYTLPEAIRNIGNSKFIIKSLIERSENREDLLDNILKEVSFAVLVVNESNLDLAYTFFNNQNSKGVPLSDFDLLKAHHYGSFREKKVDRQNTWQRSGTLFHLCLHHTERLTHWHEFWAHTCIVFANG